jgi:hypothetical protein
MVGTTAAMAGLKFRESQSSPVAVGDYPYGLVAADLDGDGDQDLAVSNFGTDNVTILRNNGSGKFTQPASSPVAVGDGPKDIVAADLDGDGDQDLAVSNAYSNTVTILRNNGSGKFAQSASSPVAVGDRPYAIVAADLDGDGDQDLAVPNISSDNVTILLNNSSGQFTPASSPVSVGHNPNHIVAADLDGDGDQDLAVTIYSDNVTILRNHGSGKFTQSASSPVMVGDNPIAIAAADLDGDGDQDLAVSNVYSHNVTILRNNGSGKFAQSASSPVAVGDRPFAIVAADLDGDGDQDLAVSKVYSHNVTILRNNGSGRFTQPASSPVAVGDKPFAIAAADLDGDGDQDLAVANGSSDNVTILEHE